MYAQKDEDGKVVGVFKWPNALAEEAPMTKGQYTAFLNAQNKPVNRVSVTEKILLKLEEKGVLTKTEANLIRK